MEIMQDGFKGFHIKDCMIVKGFLPNLMSKQFHQTTQASIMQCYKRTSNNKYPFPVALILLNTFHCNTINKVRHDNLDPVLSLFDKPPF